MYYICTVRDCILKWETSFTFVFIFTSAIKKPNKGPSFKIGSVCVNAQSLVKAEEDLKPLAEAIPDDKEQRKK